MKLLVCFGIDGIKREVTWWQPLETFPRLIKFNGHRWEWVIYNKALPSFDYEILYSQLNSYDPDYYATMEDFDEKFNQEKCTCGALYTSFKFDHMRYCAKWKKWEDI